MQWLTFENWMLAVDAAVGAKAGLSYLDLPDIDYRDRYDAGGTPVAAASAALRYAKSEMGF